MQYLNVDEVIFIHNEILLEFGGLGGIKDRQQIESVLQHIRNDNYYDSFINKSTHLFFSIVKFHCFNDGNKRTAIGALTVFFELNGFYIPDIFVKFEDIAIGVAKDEIDKKTLEVIIKSILMSFNYSQ